MLSACGRIALLGEDHGIVGFVEVPLGVVGYLTPLRTWPY